METKDSTNDSTLMGQRHLTKGSRRAPVQARSVLGLIAHLLELPELGEEPQALVHVHGNLEDGGLEVLEGLGQGETGGHPSGQWSPALPPPAMDADPLRTNKAGLFCLLRFPLRRRRRSSFFNASRSSSLRARGSTGPT